jgi:hypothetical protein
MFYFNLFIYHLQKTKTMTTNAENSNPAKSPIFNLANQLGRGFDIFGTYRLDGESAKSQLIDLDKQETKVVRFLGNDVNVPTIMNLAEQTTTHAIEGTVETRDAFQNKFAVNVGVQASYGFSAASSLMLIRMKQKPAPPLNMRLKTCIQDWVILCSTILTPTF